MSVEARSLAYKINTLDSGLERKPKESKEYKDGLQQYQDIIFQMRFILPSGLRKVVDYLDDNGKLNYEKYFKKKIDQEIINQGGKI